MIIISDACTINFINYANRSVINTSRFVNDASRNVIDDSRVMLQIVASLYNSCDDHNTFIVLITEQNHGLKTLGTTSKTTTGFV